MKSLDPRVNRLPKFDENNQINPKTSLDQFGTFEVFVQPKENKPFQHEGALHAPNLDLAYVLAKETFTRRFLCTSLCVVDTREVYVSPITEGSNNVYDLFENSSSLQTGGELYEIYHLLKRGKQHIHAGQVHATNPHQAIFNAKNTLGQNQVVYNVWAIRTNAIRFTLPEEKDLWSTLPDKKFRDAADYKGGDKLKTFLENAT